MNTRYIPALIVGISLMLNVFGISPKVPAVDLLIVNARIVDGSGNPWFRGSVAVKDGKILRVGRLHKTSAKLVINARGRIVAPGFIDVHAHTENIYDNPKAENFVRMGVTSLITGNCGNSKIEIGSFLNRIAEMPLAVNIGSLIAHGSVRKQVMGLDDRLPTDEEQKAMDDLVETAMRDGALGLSTGLIYVPGTFADSNELVELAKIAAAYKGIYASHIRGEGKNVISAVREAISIAERANLPLEISHFKIASRKLWGESNSTIGLVRAARQRGTQVTVDQYAYTASSTSLDARLPKWAIAGGREKGTARINDPETRQKIVKDIKNYLKEAGFKDLSFAYVANYRPNPAFNGKNIRQVTAMARGKKGLNAQIDQVLEMYKTGRVQMVYRMMSEEDVQNIMRQPFAMVAADSGVRVMGRGIPHPRGYGNNARVLGRYVRELKVISLENAVRKMTSLPAQTFGIVDRGLLRRGFAADIVVFDPDKVSDPATFENPHKYATGFSAVIVNGKVVFDGEKLTGNMPGKAIPGPGTRR